MDLAADLIAPCTTADLRRWVDDLAVYPRWLSIVTRAEAAEDPDGGAAWAVDLRGRLGPLARSKRLRMVRTVNDGSRFRFEREEIDGRRHSPWILEAIVTEHPTGSRLDMHLHYGGTLFGPVLERVLREEIERGRARLLGLVSGEPQRGEGS